MMCAVWPTVVQSRREIGHDMADGEESSRIRNAPEYRKTFAYGNVLIKQNGVTIRRSIVKEKAITEAGLHLAQAVESSAIFDMQDRYYGNPLDDGGYGC